MGTVFLFVASRNNKSLRYTYSNVKPLFGVFFSGNLILNNSLKRERYHADMDIRREDGTQSLEADMDGGACGEYVI